MADIVDSNQENERNRIDSSSLQMQLRLTVRKDSIAINI